MRFNIEYLKAPEYSKGAGIGAGFAAFGDSLMKIGQIGKERQKIDDENARYQEEKLFKNDELNFRKNSHADEMKAKADELAWNKDKFGKEQEWDKYKLSMDTLRADKDRAVDWARVTSTDNYYKMLAQKHADGGKNTSAAANVPEGYSLISADEIAPFIGKGVIPEGRLKKLKDGSYLIENDVLFKMLNATKEQQGIAKFLNDKASEKQNKEAPSSVNLKDLQLAPKGGKAVSDDNHTTKPGGAPMFDMEILKKKKPLIFGDKYDGAL